MERSLRFYRDLLQLRIVRTMNETGEGIDKMLSLENAQVTTVKMSADSGSTLVELLEFKSHRFKSDTDHEIFSIGPSHLALTVDDLDAVYHRLSEAGVHFNAPPQISTEGRVKVTFCQDPDGTPIELVQELKSED